MNLNSIMKPIKLKLVEKRDKKIDKFIVLISFTVITPTIIFLIGIIGINELQKEVLNILFLIIFALTFTVLLFIKDYKEIGNIIISNESIKIISDNKENTFPLEKLDGLKIELNETATDQIGKISRAKGINNYFKFIFDQTQYEYMFYIDNRFQFNHLSTFLKLLRLRINTKTKNIDENGTQLIFLMK
ncbi:MAG: hypothetical protein AB7S48_15215 [Bacteroidales bacterium]